EREFAVVIKYQLPAAVPARLGISFCRDKAGGYEVNLSADPARSRCHISLIKLSGKAVQVLGVSYSSIHIGSELQNELIARYRYGKIKVIHNGSLLFVRYDGEFKSGRIVYSATGGVKILEVRYQPTEAILFADDFMRGAEDVQHWEKISGTWIPVGADSSKFDPRLSANPFSMQGISTSNAIALTGYWFWDSYAFKAAVRPRSDDGSVGLIVYARDGTNYLLFRWTNAIEGGKQQLIAVEEGKQRVLAERDGGFVPMQWYQIEVHAGDERITTFIDGKQGLSVRCNLFGMGKVGLYADGRMIAQFDDVYVESFEEFKEEFNEPLLGRWRAIGGDWSVVSGTLIASNRRGETSTPNWLVTGSEVWEDYSLEVTFMTRGSAVGIGTHFKDVGNTYLARVAPQQAKVTYRGKCQLVRIMNGASTILAETPCNIKAGQWHKLSFKASDGVLEVSLDGVELFKVFDTTHSSGKIALFHEGDSSAAFRHIDVRFGERQHLVIPNVAPQFTRESTMVDWASSAGAWRQFGGTFWHRGDFFGLSSLRLRLPSERQFRDALSLILCGDGQDLNSGYKLVVDGSGEELVSFELQRCGKSVAKGTVRRERDESTSVELCRDGKLVLVKYDDKPLLTFIDSEPLNGRKVGVSPIRGVIDFNALQVASNHMLDYTFSGAPVDWWAAKGSWEVTERWTCSPEWSFFGGKDSQSPMLITKQSFGGDITLEVYVSIRMHEGGYNYPGDLNISICVDGLNLGSGYNFIFAGWGNSCSRILKGTRILAERTDEIGKLTKPMQHYHRYWWYLRAEKRGNKLRMFVDDVLILEAVDDKPIDSGRIAIWTVNKGISVARARIWYERRVPSKPIDELVWSVARALRGMEKMLSAVDSGKQFQVPAKFDFESDLPPIAVKQDRDNIVAVALDTSTSLSGKRSLKIMNALPGGRFEVMLINREFDAVKAPLMRFAYKLQPDVKVDMVVRAHGQTFFINFSGNAIGKNDVRLLGSIPGVVADGKWHIAEFNLAEALASKLGRRDSLIVHGIGFVNQSSNAYLLAGIGGNSFGAYFNIDDFALIQPQQHSLAKQ
ncbi:MAG: DUF1080 domain-containing protein, partial [Armatimonadetes bacterium]|nr:DUF1080 domain-containing protein [Armatimonadota bacterium]